MAAAIPARALPRRKLRREVMAFIRGRWGTRVRGACCFAVVLMLNSVHDGAMTDERLGKMLRGLFGSRILARRCAAGIEFAIDRSRALRQPAILSAYRDTTMRQQAAPQNRAPWLQQQHHWNMQWIRQRCGYACCSVFKGRCLEKWNCGPEDSVFLDRGRDSCARCCRWRDRLGRCRGDGRSKTEVIADFPPHTAVFFKLERCDGPTRMQHEHHEVAVFQRLEQ